MNLFPLVDPIPLPAPVWLMKALHIVTLSLHFVVVEMLLGGLLLAVLLPLLNRSGAGQAAAAAIARRLPIVMTYVINFGVPPLLFAQVLYGRALYTSSVLIGAWWIAIIPILTLCYWLLYRFSAGLDARRPVWWVGLLAWLTTGLIARIFTSNMTLMLRPEVWPTMYRTSAFGSLLPEGDPTLVPRWVFMLTGGFMIGGLWMVYLSARSTMDRVTGQFLARWGGATTAAAGLLYLGSAWTVFAALAPAVQSGLGANPLYVVSGFGWLAMCAVIILIGVWAALQQRVPGLVALSTPGLALVAMLTLTIYRDGLRDVTLLTKGFDVWARTVVTNWSVVAIFLGLFVLGLIVIGWLVTVVAGSKKTFEGVGPEPALGLGKTAAQGVA